MAGSSLEIGVTILVFLSSLIGFLTNALLVCAVCKYKSLQKPINCYISALCLLDTTFGAIKCVYYGAMLMDEEAEVRDEPLMTGNGTTSTPPQQSDIAHLNQGLLYVVVFCDIAYILASMNLMMSLSIQRYRALVQPLKRQCSNPRTICNIIIIVVAAFVFGAVYCIVIATCDGGLACLPDKVEPHYSIKRILDFIVIAFGYALPILVISTLSVLVIRDLRVQHDLDMQNAVAARVKRRALHMILTVFVVYLMMWAPYWVVRGYAAVTATATLISMLLDGWVVWVSKVAMVLAVSNTWINVWIYCHFSADLRRGTAQILKRVAYTLSCSQHKRGNISTTGLVQHAREMDHFVIEYHRPR